MAPKAAQHDGMAWRGRASHASSTQAWLQRAKEQTSSWPKNGLSDRAIVKLVNALPTLGRESPDLFEASAKLLLAQNDEAAWQGAMKRRLAIVRRALEGPRPNLSGGALAFVVRNDAWVGLQSPTGGDWVIHDGRSLDRFIQHGGQGRMLLWKSLIRLPALTRIEVPAKHLGQEAWAQVATEAYRFFEADHPKVRQALQSGRTWGLAIRRIKRLGLRGLFDPDTQTIIVDPRHPPTLLHELAHWVLGHTHRTDPVRAEHEVHELLKSCLKPDGTSAPTRT